MKKFRIELDECFLDDIYSEMESLSESGIGHECLINADDIEEAVEYLACELMPFLQKKFKEVKEDD